MLEQHLLGQTCQRGNPPLGDTSSYAWTEGRVTEKLRERPLRGKHMLIDSVKEEKNLIEIKYLSGIKKWCFMLIYFFKAQNTHMGHYPHLEMGKLKFRQITTLMNEVKFFRGNSIHSQILFKPLLQAQYQSQVLRTRPSTGEQ